VVEGYVGPFTALADGGRIERAEVEHSIVLERSVLHDIPARIESSLIGKDVTVTASGQRPRAHRLMLGDSSRVELG
jgi:glucose-1-phosphate thymidylyltransferase